MADEGLKLFPYYRYIINESDYPDASLNYEEIQRWANEIFDSTTAGLGEPLPPADALEHTPTRIQEVTASSLSLVYNLTSSLDLGLNWSSQPLVPSGGFDPASNWSSSLDLDAIDILNGNQSTGTSYGPDFNGSLDTLAGGYNGTNYTSPTTEHPPMPDRYSIYEVILIAVFAGFLSIATLLGNLMVMISFKIDKQLQTISNYFLFSLAVADITIGMVSMPLFTLYTLLGYWPLGPLICDTWLALDYLASNASVLNLLIISFDRYFSVTRPLTYRAKRTTRRAAVMIGSAWIISLILWPPWIYSWPHIEGRRTVPENECYIQFIETNEYVTFGTAIAAFYLPVTVMCGLYWRIWRETEKRQKDLTNLQAVKKDPSKRSNSRREKLCTRQPCLALVHSTLYLTPGLPILPDPTSFTDTGISRSEAEEVVEPEDWKRQRSESSTAMDEIETTYVPTALVMDNTKYAPQGRDVGKAAGCCRGLASCIKRTVDREDTSTQAAGHRAGYHTPGYHTPGYHTPGYHTPGYHTPGSVETSLPSSVSRCTSLNYIREPMSVTPTRYRQNSMIPLVERAERPDHHHHHHHHHHHGASTLPRAESTLGVGARAQVGGRLQARSHSSDSVYTILIRLPHDPSQDGPLHPPSILMIEEEGQEGGGPGGGHKLRFDRGTSPLARRGDSVCSDPSGQATRVECSLHPGGPEGTSPVPLRRTSHAPDIKIPLNAKIIPKQLAKNSGAGGTGAGGGATGGGANAGGGIGSGGKKKKKKKNQEKKQDRKAAKTLSAILLTFIVTWTPYNVLVLLKTLMACNADDCIPRQLWDFSYYLCYINSTINPMCYALCNAAFRRTYVRILTCKWHSRRKQGVQRGYYS
ncbi:muscarinic acetylcholine receptor DM1-like isoform X2 [Penaeus chinensis]|uniref:muscarinic acetylcholine receptor DM1-like isoform X2 n=1 Tax=Penaeus chinensis TaxID=139456 RepID=UPI001FB646A3|nr:muscarinic acetylcholine receptor DM1-like isoform X2 [Penaeus chinensis]